MSSSSCQVVPACSQGVQWIQMWGMRQLACGPGSPGKTLATAGALSTSPLPEATAGWLQNWVISRSVLPATDQKLAETCSANRLRKHHQSSSLQDTEWASARNADKSSPIFLESWQRHNFCSSKNCAGWNIPMSLSKKRSWLVSPDQQIILFHVWPVSHSSGPVTFHGVYPNTGFNPLKCIFGWPEESWLSPKAAALATLLGNLPVHRVHCISDEDYEDLSSRSWSHTHYWLTVSYCHCVLSSYQHIYSSLSQICALSLYIFIRNMRIDRIGRHCGCFGHHRPFERIYSLVMVCTFVH